MNEIILSSLNFIDTHFETTRYIPFISTVTGSLRIVSSIVLLSGSILSALYSHYKKSDSSLLQAKINIAGSLLNVAKGCVEIIPIIGNVVAFIISDQGQKIKNLEKQLNNSKVEIASLKKKIEETNSLNAVDNEVQINITPIINILSVTYTSL